MGAQQGTWEQPIIVGDPRILGDDPMVRAVAEHLHRMESMHLHVSIDKNVCVYCALRASNAVQEMRRFDARAPLPVHTEED